jgi:serine/threonine protein kinase
MKVREFLVKREHVCFHECILNVFFSDVVGNMIGHGATANVYEALLEKLNSEVQKVAVKVFFPTDVSDDSIVRDITHGLDKRLSSDYTLTYIETFVYKQYRCVSMPLMQTSLQKFLNPYIEKGLKRYFDDDVCGFFHQIICI